MGSVVSLGYTCICGERVRVFELKRGEENRLPYCATVACPNGHSATFSAAQVGLLEVLVDESGGTETDSQRLADDENEDAA